MDGNGAAGAGAGSKGLSGRRALAGMALAGMLAPVCVGQTTAATYPWQKMQMPTAGEVAREMEGAAAGVWPGALLRAERRGGSREVLERDLDTAVRSAFML
jgi:hypothetical protein